MNKKLTAGIAIIACFAVIAQLCLLLQNTLHPLVETLLRFFSYFTILTNILVAVCFTVLSLQKNNNGFFTRAGVQTAITVYIIVVGMIYNLILRFTWAPEGLQRLVDELLHTAVPIAVIIYWGKYVSKKTLHYKDCFWWMLFPFTYIVWVAIRGMISGFYPYPFIDVNKLGYQRTLLNCFGMLLVFMGLSLFLTAISKWNSRRQPL